MKATFEYLLTSRYEITPQGKVYSRVSKKWLKTTMRNGYKAVTLQIQSERKTINIHRLVAALYVPNPENKPQVNHKNGDKLDNHVDNLEWVTASENRIHSHEMGLQTYRTDDNHHWTKIPKEEVSYIRKLYNTGYFYQYILADIFGLSQSYVCELVTRQKRFGS